ncbi:MAG TPA: VCBS repeat-containing protein [bacterium]|nr:VCBS repeat-containing protein [bacterium]
MKIIRIKTLIIISVFFTANFLSHSAKADTFKAIDKDKKYLYKKGLVFTVSDLTGDKKGEVITQIPGKKNLLILRWNGIWFRKLGEIKTPFEKISDVAVGDVDNDGTDEIAVIAGKELYVFENKNNKFVLDPTKTTPLYGEKRFGKKEILETMNKFVEGRVSGAKKYGVELVKLDFEKLEGKRVIIGDVDNDGANEMVVSKLTPIIEEGVGYSYTLDILKWKKEHFEVIYCNPSPVGPGDAGISISDLNIDGDNELIFGGSNGGFEILKYNKSKDYFWTEMSVWIREKIYDQRINVSNLNGQNVLVYSIIEPEGEDTGKTQIVYLNKDAFPVLGKTFNKIGGEERFIWPDEFASRFPIRHISERFEGIKSFVIGNLDNDKENELIVNTAAGAYIYGLKFNVALIVTIIIGAVLIIALAVFFLIRTRRRKKAVVT